MSGKSGGKTVFCRIVFCSAAFLCMLGIFIFSAQSSDVSWEVSGSFIELIAPFFYPDFGELDICSRSFIVDSLQSVVRTCAHGFSYFMLGFLSVLCLNAFNMCITKSLAISVVICILYAFTDELHQYFVPGRSMQTIDILVDSCGAVLGSALACVSLLILRRKNKKNG